MNYRKLGKNSFSISEISLGTWQVSDKWGAPFSHGNNEAYHPQALRTFRVVDSVLTFTSTLSTGIYRPK